MKVCKYAAVFSDTAQECITNAKGQLDLDPIPFTKLKQKKCQPPDNRLLPEPGIEPGTFRSSV